VPSLANELAHLRGRTHGIAHVVPAVKYSDKIAILAGKLVWLSRPQA
jgi:hypothetical protein